MTAERVPAAMARARRAEADLAAGAEDLAVPLPRDPAPRRTRPRPDDEPRRTTRRRGRGTAEPGGDEPGRPRRSGESGRDGNRRDGRSGADAERAGVDASRSRMRVAPPAPVAAPRTPFVLLVLTLVAGGIVGLLVLNTAINADAFKITALRDQQSRLDTQEQQLNQELADLQSPGNLQAAATRLGLVPAGTPAFLRLPDGRILNVPQPARSGSSAGR
jgi:hypothetical protein